MTERSRGAPDPFDPPAGAEPVFPDLSAVRRSDALMEALASGDPLPAGERADDPAARLLRALLDDVGTGADESMPRDLGDRPDRRDLHDPGVQRDRRDRPGRRRRTRALVTAGMAAPLVAGALYGTGAAATDGGLVDRLMPGQSAEQKESAEAYERSRAELETARRAMERGNYDGARESLESARLGRTNLSGEQALDLDRRLRELERDLGAALPDSPDEPSSPSKPAPPAKSSPHPRPDTPSPKPRPPAQEQEPTVESEPSPEPTPTGTPTPSATEPSERNSLEHIRKRAKARADKYRRS